MLHGKYTMNSKYIRVHINTWQVLVILAQSMPIADTTKRVSTIKERHTLHDYKTSKQIPGEYYYVNREGIRKVKKNKTIKFRCNMYLIKEKKKCNGAPKCWSYDRCPYY